MSLVTQGKIPVPSTGKRLAIYCRKSSIAEGEARGRSVSEQYSQCVLAANPLGFEVTERLTFLEEDGNRGDWFWADREQRHPGPHRPELTRLMEAVENGEVDAIMVWRTDRIYRDDIVAGYFLRKLREHGVRLFARMQDLFIHTASGYQAAATEAAANKAYRDRIAEDVERAHTTNAQNGLLIRDPSALGFRSAGKGTGRAVPVPDELDTVRLMYRLYLEGVDGEAPLSANAVAERLMQLGRRTSVGARGHKSKDPTLIGVTAITRTLRNAAYCGLIEKNGNYYETRLFDVPDPDGGGRMGTVVSRETWEAAGHRLDHGDRYERDTRAKLLSGVVLCPCCGRKMYPDTEREGRRQALHCRHRRSRFRSCSGGPFRTILVETMEDWCRQHLAPLLAAELVALHALQRGDDLATEIQTSERKLAEALKMEGEQLSALMGSLDAQQIAAVARKLRENRESIQSRLCDLRAKARHQAETDQRPVELLSVDVGLLRAALLRAVRWVTITRKGVVVLTRSGAYIGAYLASGDKRETGGHRPPKILPPSVEATRECRSWIEDREAFLAGARLSGGRWAHTPADEEILPEYHEEALD